MHAGVEIETAERAERDRAAIARKRQRVSRCGRRQPGRRVHRNAGAVCVELCARPDDHERRSAAEADATAIGDCAIGPAADVGGCISCP